MKRSKWFGGVGVFVASVSGLCAAAEEKPNVLIIYADDIGYGDLSCYGAKGVETPNIDKLAKQGIRFTDAYSSAATCTPSRYSILTGQYAWRKPGTQILQGDAAMIIEPGRQTLPSVMKQAGYGTAMVGKWHLGLGDGRDTINWNQPINPNPTHIGFDRAFYIPATNDRVPCVYMTDSVVRNGGDPNDPIFVDYKKKVGVEPTGKENPGLLRLKHSHGHNMTIVNGVGRIGWMTGGHAARWRDEEMPELFLDQSFKFIDETIAQKKPFFLMFNAIDIHVPRLPHPRFIGSSKLGARGDVLVQFDWTVGELMKKLDKLGIADNTIVILSSDNGPAIDDGYVDSAVQLGKAAGHSASGACRGTKYTALEGGSRVPFILRYPKGAKGGITSKAVVSQLDLLASFGAMHGIQADPVTAGDSFDMRDALFGKDDVGRDFLIMQGMPGLSCRTPQYKYIPGKIGNGPKPALYDLTSDIGEKNNIADKHPEIVQDLQKKLNHVTGGKVYLR